MTNKIVVLVLSLLTVGCGYQDKSHDIDVQRVSCVDGVSYYRYDRSVTVLLDVNGKVVPCNGTFEVNHTLCINHVRYWSYDRSIAVMLDRNSNPIKCRAKE